MSETTPRPGRGTRLTMSSLGWALSTSPARASFRHPWRATLAGNKLQINRGVVDLVEPKIGDKLMSEAGTFVKLDASKKNKAGESWVSVEVEPNSDGFLDLKSRIEIVQTNDPLFYTPKIGRFPLVMILWKGTAAVQMQQIAFFNARYHQVKDGTSVRHFFL